MASETSYGVYVPEMGVLPTLELYELNVEERKAARVREEIPLFNWRLFAVNGERLARGSGEKFGAFKSLRSAWRNACLTGFAFGGDRLPDNTPRSGADMAVVDEETGKPVLRIRRP